MRGPRGTTDDNAARLSAHWRRCGARRARVASSFKLRSGASRFESRLRHASARAARRHPARHAQTGHRANACRIICAGRRVRLPGAVPFKWTSVTPRETRGVVTPKTAKFTSSSATTHIQDSIPRAPCSPHKRWVWKAPPPPLHTICEGRNRRQPAERVCQSTPAAGAHVNAPTTRRRRTSRTRHHAHHAPRINIGFAGRAPTADAHILRGRQPTATCGTGACKSRK